VKIHSIVKAYTREKELYECDYGRGGEKKDHVFFKLAVSEHAHTHEQIGKSEQHQNKSGVSVIPEGS
jgi:hypothetical protein